VVPRRGDENRVTDLTAHTALIGEKAAELNELISQLPRTCKAEVSVDDFNPIQNQFPVPHIEVTVLQWLGGNRRG
jgi:hypothetical protein